MNVYRNIMLLVALFTSFSFILAGCSTQAPVDPLPTEENDTKNQTIDNNVLVTNQTKNATEIIQDTLEQAIADGTYTDEVSYNYHSGSVSMRVDVTVENDIITEASLAVVQADSTSTRYIGKVNDALPELVIGKKINEIALPKQVSGSSLTTKALQQHLTGLVDDY